MKPGTIKLLGFVATAIGFGATILANWVADKTLDEKIEERINVVLTERSNEEES